MILDHYPDYQEIIVAPFMFLEALHFHQIGLNHERYPNLADSITEIQSIDSIASSFNLLR